MSMQGCQSEFAPLMASSRRKIANMVCFGERSSTFFARSSAQIGDCLAISRVMRWVLGIKTILSFFWMGWSDTTPRQPEKFTTARESNFAPPCVSQPCSNAIPFYSCCDRGEKVDASIFNPRTLALIIKPNNQTPSPIILLVSRSSKLTLILGNPVCDKYKTNLYQRNRMSGQPSEPMTPNVQRLLYQKYSSSQTYFYTNKINEIVRERRSAVNIFYEDVEYLLDLEENLKRWYQMREYDNKMFTFKEYYFYHQDCPRIFLKGIEEAYAKWQDKKRDLVYKRLKIAYNESDSSETDSRLDDQKSQNYVALSHFLLEISEYNPYSKKYYLRADAKKDKEKKKYEQEKRNQSKRDLQSLKNDLSAMLNDISQLSDISTLQSVTPKNTQKYKSLKLGTISIKKSQQRSGNSSSNLSNSNSLIKFNFKKHKESNQKLKETRKISLRKEVQPKQDSKPDERRLSPRYNSNVAPNQLIKTRSIFSVSSFGALRNTDIKPNNKRDQLKLNFESKKLVIDDTHKKYETEKKKEPSRSKILTIQTKSTSKFEPRHSLQKLKSKDSSTGKSKQDEFSDKKMSDANSQFRMRSLKSEFISSSKKALLSIKPTLQRNPKLTQQKRGSAFSRSKTGEWPIKNAQC